MTEPEKDDLVESIAIRAIEAVGPDEAPGVLWAALLSAHLRHHSLALAVLCIESGLRDLRQQIAAAFRNKGSIQ